MTMLERFKKVKLTEGIVQILRDLKTVEGKSQWDVMGFAVVVGFTVRCQFHFCRI
jgi:hypothetical protein